MEFSLAAAFVFTFIYDMNRLLGQNVLLNFVTGRYHRPRVETRVFLFIDMEGSTAFAERLGPLAFHRLLNRFVVDLSEPISAARGEIHSYVGDELIATWKLDEGIAHAHCVTACFAAMDQLARLAPEYLSEFGVTPNFRAGLHCGPVVTGEMGSLKKEIVFLGDTVNTTARIQEMCRQTGERVLASADVVDRLELPPGVVKRSLGGLRLRGKENDVALYALTRTKEEAVRFADPDEAGVIRPEFSPPRPHEEGPGLDFQRRGDGARGSRQRGTPPHLPYSIPLALRQINVQYPGSTAMVQPKSAGGEIPALPPERKGRCTISASSLARHLLPTAPIARVTGGNVDDAKETVSPTSGEGASKLDAALTADVASVAKIDAVGRFSKSSAERPGWVSPRWRGLRRTVGSPAPSAMRSPLGFCPAAS